MLQVAKIEQKFCWMVVIVSTEIIYCVSVLGISFRNPCVGKGSSSGVAVLLHYF